MANFFTPMVLEGQRPGGRRVPGPGQQNQQPVPLMQQQIDDAMWADVPVLPSRNVLDASMCGIRGGGMVSVSYDIRGMTLRETGISQPIPISALASALANASPTVVPK
ncbi:hypothetical protein L1887_13393 [Cichorium endivia]|nr:hypothetical protein L1887_13393 [Cichorium endivia]